MCAGQGWGPGYAQWRRLNNSWLPRAIAQPLYPTHPHPARHCSYLPEDAALPGGKRGKLDVARQPAPLAVPLPPIALPWAVHPHHDLRKGH